MASESGEQLEHLLSEAGAPFYRRYRRPLILAAAAIAVLLIAAFYFLKGGDKTEYLTKEVRRGSLTATVTATGTLEPVVEVQVGTEVSGIIDSVLVRENDVVTAGQVLAKLDTTRLQAQVNSSTAALRVAEAQVMEADATERQSRSELNRVKTLIANGWRSASELDVAQATYDRAAAALAQAKARVLDAAAVLKSNQTNLDKAIIRAPINGVVLTRLVDPGQTVAATFQTPVLFTIAQDLRRMQVKANIDEADIGVVKTGEDATFSVDAYPNRTFAARVSSVRFAPTTTAEGVTTYEALLDVQNDDLSLRPGMTATADIVTGRVEDRLLAPNAALRFEPPQIRGPGERNKSTSGDRVWIMKDGAPAPVALTTGATDGEWSEVVSGDLAPGMAVIVGVAQPAAAP